MLSVTAVPAPGEIRARVLLCSQWEGAAGAWLSLQPAGTPALAPGRGLGGVDVQGRIIPVPVPSPRAAAAAAALGLASAQESEGQYRAIFHILYTVSPVTEPLPTPGKHRLKIKVNFRALGKEIVQLKHMV